MIFKNLGFLKALFNLIIQGFSKTVLILYTNNFNPFKILVAWNHHCDNLETSLRKTDHTTQILTTFKPLVKHIVNAENKKWLLFYDSFFYDSFFNQIKQLSEQNLVELSDVGKLKLVLSEQKADANVLMRIITDFEVRDELVERLKNMPVYEKDELWWKY